MAYLTPRPYSPQEACQLRYFEVIDLLNIINESQAIQVNLFAERSIDLFTVRNLGTLISTDFMKVEIEMSNIFN